VSTSASSIQEVVGDGCKNDIDFTATFTKDNGDVCDTCAFCKGQNLNSIFIPKSGGICIECSEASTSCRNLKITTNFKTPFNMKFLYMSSGVMSDMSYRDPRSIVVEGSTDLSSWSELYSTTDHEGALFESRNQLKELLFDNNNASFRHYRINFEMHPGSPQKMQVGHYGIVQSYTKQCVSHLHAALTNNYILPYNTPSPTLAPTFAPTANPTRPPPSCTGSNQKRVNNKCFIGYPDHKNWHGAKAHCASQGLQFASIENQNEQNAVHSVGTCNYPWIGLKSKATTDGPNVGTWFWDVNPPIDITPGKSYENWESNQQKGTRYGNPQPPYCGGVNRKDWNSMWWDNTCFPSNCFICMYVY